MRRIAIERAFTRATNYAEIYGFTPVDQLPQGTPPIVEVSSYVPVFIRKVDNDKGHAYLLVVKLCKPGQEDVVLEREEVIYA